MEEKDLNKLLGYIAETAMPHCEAESCFIVVYDRYGHSYSGFSNRERKKPSKTDLEIIDRVVQSAKIANDIVRRTEDGKIMLCLPFNIRNTFTGFLYLDRPKDFGQEQMESARLIVELLTTSIENAFLRSKLLTDQLTGLHNSSYFKQLLEKETSIASRMRKNVALLLIDIDNFRLANDLYGTKIGDQILIRSAEVIARSLRSAFDVVARRIDVWLETHIGRYGGDEFAILLFDVSRQTATQVAQNIVQNFRQALMEIEGHRITATVSVGLALMPDDAANSEQLFIKAYEALYVAKTGGKDQFWAHGSQEKKRGTEIDPLVLSAKGRTVISLILQVVSADMDLDTTLQKTLTMLLQATNAERGCLMLFDDQGQPRDIARVDMSDAEVRRLEARTDLRPERMSCVFGSAQRNVGALHLLSSKGQFSQEDYSLMRLFAAKVAVPLDRVRKLKHLEDRIRRGMRELSQKYHFANIVGKSKAMQEVFAIMERVCEVDYPVVIEGETGTGKELVAKSIHYNSKRKDRPFVPVNCAALPETLLESELFGYIKGAFTGADKDHTGLFVVANGGTLFLDEIEVMPHSLQQKLLRVLEESKVKPVGSNAYVPINVRVLASTNQRSKELLAQNRLREDLYYRLSTFIVYLPPLRERAEDIPLIADFLLGEVARELTQPKKRLSAEAEKIFMAYAWPGNIRELRNELRKAHVMSRGEVIEPTDLSSHMRNVDYTAVAQRAGGDYAKALEEFEKTMIMQALEQYKWNMSKACEALGFARNTLKAKMKKYGIKPPGGEEGSSKIDRPVKN